MKKRLIIEGMHCQNCVTGLSMVLTEDLEGVTIDDINLEVGYADVYVSDGVTNEEIKFAVEELGFKLKEII